jgi:hypothetical protein
MGRDALVAGLDPAWDGVGLAFWLVPDIGAGVQFPGLDRLVIAVLARHASSSSNPTSCREIKLSSMGAWIRPKHGPIPDADVPVPRLPSIART